MPERIKKLIDHPGLDHRSMSITYLPHQIEEGTKEAIIHVEGQLNISKEKINEIKRMDFSEKNKQLMGIEETIRDLFNGGGVRVRTKFERGSSPKTITYNLEVFFPDHEKARAALDKLKDIDYSKYSEYQIKLRKK